MNKKITSFLLAAVFIFFTGHAQAFEPVTSEAMMVYYQIPFGAHTRKQNTNTFGFRLDTIESSLENGTVFMSFNGKEAIMDLQFTKDGINAWEFGGVNTLVERTVYNATDGSDETVTGIDWGLVFIGIAGAVALADGIKSKDKECEVSGDYVGIPSMATKYHRNGLLSSCDR